MQDGAGADQQALREAQQTIARQAEEIERLRRRVEEDRFGEELRDTLALAATAGTIAAPVTHTRLLEMIVETAADVINARAASLFLIDRATEELVFEVALGEKADEVKKFRVPLGKGLAGLVAMTGQPMAIADTEQDNRDADDIAQAIGYKPKNMLCVPLFYQDEVIGVIELLDKEGAPSFSPTDMESLGLFATQAAVAIEQSRTQRNLAAMLSSLLESYSGVPEYRRKSLEDRARTFVDGMEEDSTYQRSLELARLIQEISRRGERELQACEAILKSFAEYLRSQPASASELGWGGGVG